MWWDEENTRTNQFVAAKVSEINSDSKKFQLYLILHEEEWKNGKNRYVTRYLKDKVQEWHTMLLTGEWLR